MPQPVQAAPDGSWAGRLTSETDFCLWPRCWPAKPSRKSLRMLNTALSWRGHLNTSHRDNLPESHWLTAYRCARAYQSPLHVRPPIRTSSIGLGHKPPGERLRSREIHIAKMSLHISISSVLSLVETPVKRKETAFPGGNRTTSTVSGPINCRTCVLYRLTGGLRMPVLAERDTSSDILET